MRLILFVIFIFFYSNVSNAQSTIQFKATSIRPGDSCTIIIQKSAENFYQKKLIAAADSTVSYTFSNISNGKWSVKIDATGYYYPTAKVVELNNNTILVEIKLTPITLANSVNYVYEWKDDSSYLGHAQQSYINDPVSIVVLNDTIKLPDNTASVNLYNKYGITLSDELTQWSAEDAFRLYQTIETVPLFQTYGEGNKVKINSVWKITNDEVIDDISVTTSGDVKLVTISRKAFVYANPSVVLVDGVRGKFFSKRLHHAVVAFATNFGFDKDAIARLAKERYGFTFMVPGSELSTLMKEDASNFQEFSAFEKLTIIGMIEELPDGMHLQTNLKYMVRRIAGQVNPKKPEAAAIAWIGSNTIEFMNGAFQDNSYFDIQRLVLHEKSHFLWAGLFDNKLKDDWSLLGGWFLDPTSLSGWSTSNTTEFVSAYAHLKDPNEDMAESVAFYVLNPDKLRSRSLKKFEFIRDRIMDGTRYVAMIRKDLTFTVYNLFPDYNYPGKIKRVNVSVDGLPNEDKKVTLEIELSIIDSLKDGASSAYARFTSSAGTFFDIGLSPVNAIGSILRGTATVSKFIKSGYWNVNQIQVYDAVGNMRVENNSTYGLKLHMDNPKEDLLPPAYKHPTLKLSKGNSKFSSMETFEDVSGLAVQYVEAKFDVIEKNALTYVGLNFALPKLDEKGVKTELQLGVLNPKGIDTSKYKYYLIDSKDTTIKHVTYRYPIPDYFPKGYYEATMINLVDEGENRKRAFFMNDTSKFTIGKFDSLNISKHLRDSIYIETPYPDYIPPVLDVNAITISAKPTRPEAPDGETLFEMEFFAKDSSVFSGKESGIKHGSYILRDPQGKQFGISMQSDFNKIKGDFYYLITDPSGNPGIWRKYKVSTLLPRGSAPGLWGVESIDLYDRANNVKHYNFVELVRFDLEKDIEGEAVDPKVEILNKKVNARNVDSINMAISCVNCKNKIFRARIYSDMGGNSVVYEGTMTADSITIKNIKLTGVNDGILYTTVFILDTSKVLLGIGKSKYTKDVVPPKSTLLQTNLSNLGKSNLDSLIYDIHVNEVNTSYKLVLTQRTLVKSNSLSISDQIIKSMGTQSMSSNIGDSIVIYGKMSDSVFKLKNLNLNQFLDGIIELKLIISDSIGNETVPNFTNIYKDTKEPILAFKKISLNNLKAVYNLESNEYLSNNLSKEHLTINAGFIDSVKKISNQQFNIFITRICNDTINLSIKANVLKDTVGNYNFNFSSTNIEKLIPEMPLVSDVTYCNYASSDTIRINPTNGNSILWYGVNEIGGTSTNTAIKPQTTVVGTTYYYVSQINNITGCEGPRAKINVTINPIPLAPILSRDTSNYLISNTSNVSWYKDGILITDTTQKIKPVSAGLYTAKTIQNGCISSISAPYYFLITDLINLSANEFLKLAPNPFNSHLNLDFLISGYQKLNIDIYELSTGRLLFNKQGLYPGTQILLGTFSSGTYIVRVYSSDFKMTYTFKLVKL